MNKIMNLSNCRLEPCILCSHLLYSIESDFGFFQLTLVIDISNQLHLSSIFVRHSRDTNIDDACARLDDVSSYEVGNSCCGNDDVRNTQKHAELLFRCVAVTNCRRGVT